MTAGEQALSSFTVDLASNLPAPGGGGAAALAGALCAALASMVGNLTTGKKKYAQYEADIQKILKDAEALRAEMLDCIDADAECFEPLSKAYGIPKDDPTHDTVMEEALRLACTAPLRIMRLAAGAIALHEELAEKGSALMISDVGVGAVCGKAALLGASLNIRINAKQMSDKEYAVALLTEVEEMVGTYSAIADGVYEKVLRKIN